MSLNPKNAVGKDLEEFRSLQSFCKNDLKSLMNILQTSLSLYTEEYPRPQTEIDHIMHQGLDSLRSALKKLETAVLEHRSNLKMIWYLGNEKIPEISDSKDDSYIVQIESLNELRSKLNEYQPEAIIFQDAKLIKLPADALNALRRSRTRLVNLSSEKCEWADLNMDSKRALLDLLPEIKQMLNSSEPKKRHHG